MRVLTRRDISSKLLFLCFVSILFLLPLSVQATEFGFRPINNVITPGENAYVEIDVINTDSIRKDFTINSADFRWHILSDPPSDFFSGFSVNGGETRTLKLQFSPRGDLFFGIYSIRLEFFSRTTGERHFVDVPIEIRSLYTGTVDYAPSVMIEGTVNNNNRIDPRQTSVLVINLDNRNPLNITSIDIAIESPFINEYFTTSLAPLEKKRIEFNFDVDDYQEPGIKDFTLRLIYNDRNIAGTPRSFPVQVISYSSVIKDIDDESGFLSRRKVVTLTNKGNVENSDVVQVPVNFFSRIFTTATPSPKIETVAGERFFTWYMDLNPGSSVEINVSVNYRPLLYFLLIVSAVLVLYYMLRSPVVVKKTAAGFNSYDEGISEIKILMHIKNRTAKPFNAFSVTEYVPKIAKYLKSDTLGSIQPTKVLNHEKKGTLLKWNFEAIEPFEERIIIYKMKLNFTVLGRLNFPATTVKFKDDSNGSYTTKSNKLRIHNVKKSDEKKSQKKGGKSDGKI